MSTYIVVSLAGGILFAMMDGLLNANPLAQRLYTVFHPISRKQIDIIAGLLVDLAYGFLLAGLFLLLYRALPGEAGWLKGLSFAAVVWFLRVVMSTMSQWMMYRLPLASGFYMLGAGLLEMAALGLLFGLTIAPE